MTFILLPGGSVISGTHDRTPHHEIWGGPLPGEYVQFYGRPIAPRLKFGCLSGVGACTVAVDARI